MQATQEADDEQKKWLLTPTVSSDATVRTCLDHLFDASMIN